MSDQIAFEGMPEKLFPITPSKLDTWLSCPRKYRYQYVDYPKPPKGGPRAVTTMGISIHNGLKDWFRLETEQRTTAAAESLLRAAWRDDVPPERRRGPDRPPALHQCGPRLPRHRPRALPVRRDGRGAVRARHRRAGAGRPATPDPPGGHHPRAGDRARHPRRRP